MCFKYSLRYLGLLPQFRLVALVNTLFIAALAVGLNSSDFYTVKRWKSSSGRNQRSSW